MDFAMLLVDPSGAVWFAYDTAHTKGAVNMTDAGDISVAQQKLATVRCRNQTQWNAMIGMFTTAGNHF